MGDCKNCLCNLDKCKASCCRVFSISKDAHIINKNNTMILRGVLTKDMQWYMRLHGAKVGHGKIMIDLNKYELTEDEKNLYFNRDCDALTKDNLCKLHPDKPEVCKAINWETRNDSRFTLTENCIYREERDD